MLRMALNRHESAHYRRQRKRALLTQLVRIIACSALYEERRCLETMPTFKPCRHTSLMRAVVVRYGLVQYMFRFS